MEGENKNIKKWNSFYCKHFVVLSVFSVMFVFNNLGFSLLTFQKCFETSLYFCAIYNKYSLSLLLKNMQTAKGDFLVDNKGSNLHYIESFF